LQIKKYKTTTDVATFLYLYDEKEGKYKDYQNNLRYVLCATRNVIELDLQISLCIKKTQPLTTDVTICANTTTNEIKSDFLAVCIKMK
jgi:hypothetical protein